MSPLRDFLQNFQGLWTVPPWLNRLNLGICSSDFGIMALSLGVHLFQIVSAPIAPGNEKIGCFFV